MPRRKRDDGDFQAEIEAHIQLEEDRLRAEGLSAAEARAAALRHFGNRTARREEFYESTRSLWWEHLWRDLRLVLRSFGRERSFAVFAILLIGLGAGLTAAMFALYSGVALRKIAVPDPDALVQIAAVKDNQDPGIRYAMFERLRETFDAAEAVTGWNSTIFPVTYDGETQVLQMQYMAGDFTGAMGMRPIQGRVLRPSDTGAVAMISDAYWRRIGGDPAIVGKVLRAGPVALTVVGVVSADSLEFIRFYKSDIVVPLETGAMLEGVSPDRVGRYPVNVIARLKPGVTQGQAQQRLDALWDGLVKETVQGTEEEWVRLNGRQGRVLPGSRGFAFTDKNLPKVALTLLLLAALVSLIMCTNFAGLLLSRSLGKEKEYGLRLALGAGRWRVIRYAFVEVLVLSCAGAAVAVLLARWLTDLCVWALLDHGSITADYGVKVDGWVIAAGLLLSVMAAFAAQLIPVLRISDIRVTDSIRPGLQTFSARLGGRKAVLVVQVAASLVLVSGSLLFVRTLQSLARTETGFHAENVMAVRLASRVPWSEAGPEFFFDLLRRVREIPGVTSASLSNRVPMEGEYVASDPIEPDEEGAVTGTTSDRGCVWPGFFETLRTPLLAGRDIAVSDTNALLVTRSLAEDLFPGGMAVGQHVRFGAAPRTEVYEVVGVVEDVRLRSPRQANTRIAFEPCHHVWKPPQSRYAMGLVIRVDDPMADVETAVRRHVEEMGKQAVLQVLPLNRLISRSMRNERTLSSIATGFGAFTLFLTCVGVYALIDLTVQLRRRELGIRMALGANGARVLVLVLSGLGRILAAGALAGLALSYAVSRAYSAYLYGEVVFEPWLMAGSFGVVALFALAAAILPAWRAARTEPAIVLRLGA